MAALLSLRLGEGGAGLSLGQQQQLCLARLLMLRPRIVVLDEATAHVDAAAAAAMHALVAQQFADSTVLSIAVRHWSTIKHLARTTDPAVCTLPS